MLHAAPTTGLTAAPAAALPRTILVVEDNRTVADSLGAVLRRQGFATAVFTSGREALTYAAQSASDPAAAPAAALIDVHLPDISGLVLTQKLRQRLGPDLPIIIISGDTSMATLNSLPHVGATLFFSKPVQSSQLIQRLRELVA